MFEFKMEVHVKKLLMGLIGLTLCSIDILAMKQEVHKNKEQNIPTTESYFILSEEKRAEYVDDMKRQTETVLDFLEITSLNGETDRFISELIKNLRNVGELCPKDISTDIISTARKIFMETGKNDYPFIWENANGGLFPKAFQTPNEGAATNLYDFLSYHLQENGTKLLEIAARAGCPTILKWLIGQGINVNFVNYFYPPLSLAILSGNFEAVQVIMPLSNLNLRDDIHRTSFRTAVSNGSLEIVQYLQEYFTKIENTKKELMGAVYNDDIEVFKYLLPTNDPNYCDGRGSVLYNAMKLGKINFVKALLDDERTNPNLFPDGRLSPLEWAVIMNQTETFQYLLKNNKINLEAKYWCPESLLHIAVINNNIDIVSILLENCGQTNQYKQDPECEEECEEEEEQKNIGLQDKDAMSAMINATLYTAIYLGNVEIVKLLMSSDKIDINQDSINYFILDHMFFLHGNSNSFFRKHKIFYKHVGLGATFNLDDLYITLKKWDVNTTELGGVYHEKLSGSKIESIPPFRSLLQGVYSSSEHMSEVFECIIKSGKLNVDYKSPSTGNTYLHIVVMQKLGGLVRPMLTYGFKKHILTNNKKNSTPVDIAKALDLNKLAEEMTEWNKYRSL